MPIPAPQPSRGCDQVRSFGPGASVRTVAGLLAVCGALTASAVQAPQPPAKPAQPVPKAAPETESADGARPVATRESLPVTQPPNGASSTPPAAPGGPEDEITLSAFTEPVELSALVEYVAKALNVNIFVKGSLSGSVVFNTPVSVKRSQLLKILDALLEQQNFTITLDNDGFYTVHPVNETPSVIAGEQPTTMFIPTPNVRPSYLRNAVYSQLGMGSPGGQNEQPAQPGGPRTGLAYLDELGVIVATDSPRRLESLQKLVNGLLEEYAKTQFIRLELEFVAAPVARTRMLELVGQSSGTGQAGVNPQTGEVQMPGPQGAARGVDNLADRLTVDALGNSLIFRGRPDEIRQLKELVLLIDAPNNLLPESYYAGSAAKQVADLARLRGLGEVTLISAPQQNQNPYAVNFGIGFDPNNPQSRPRGQSTTGGPVMVVDEARGTIIYYGTREQQKQLAELIELVKVDDERTIIRAYKLRHSDADQVSELILGLIQNTTPAGSSDLLPESGGFGNSSGASSFRANRRNPTTLNVFQNPANQGSGEGISLSESENIFVLADKANNQVLVKAPAKDQPDFERLINSLDLRKSQVFIEAKIVALIASDAFRLAFETQLINANGSGGVINTNFGLSTFPADANLNDPKNVRTGLLGLTSAIIKSDQVPIIIHALQNVSDTRILSSPQILVDDNQEATIASVDQQPTTETTQTSGNPTTTSFSGYEDAGTELTVKPQISSGGYLRLKYEAKLSSFTGTGSDGIPPPKQENTIKSDSISIPSDATVVVGGLVLDNKRKTVLKVPLLGDIPIIGALFSDQNTDDRKTVLYIFLTPKILRDPTFEDLRLLTRGPQAEAKIDPDAPELKPSVIDIIAPVMPDAKLEEEASGG